MIYINEVAQRLFKSDERNIRQELPKFDASNLVGAAIDVFYKIFAREPSPDRKH